MQQQGDRRQATSGSRSGANFWVEEKDNFGTRMMRGMGWEQGKGLGKKEDGEKQYLKAKYKADSKGIGASGNQEDATWTATQDLYTDLLKRLKTENSPSPTGSPVEESVEVSESTTTSSAAADGSSNTTTVLKNYIAKRTLYGRFKRSKDTASYGSTAMSEIFGRKPTTPTPAAVEEVKKPKYEAPPEHDLLKTNKVSIRDYFAQKLAAAGKLGGMSASQFASGGIAKPEPAVKEEEEAEQPHGFTMGQQEDYYTRMMACAIGGTGVQTGMRAKVGLGFGGAGTGGNTGVKAPSGLNAAKRSIKIEVDNSAEPEVAPSPVASYEEEAIDAAAVDAAPHGTHGHDDEEAKLRRKAEKKAAKKRKRESESAPAKSADSDADDEKAAKKAKKQAKKEAAAAAEAAAKAEAEAAAAAAAKAEKKRAKKEKKSKKKKSKDSSDSD